MAFHYIFINDAGRIRSGWRFFIFIAAFIFVALAIDLLFSLLVFGSHENAEKFFGSIEGRVVGSLVTILIATILGWGCGRVFEDLPLRALGWALHRGWWRDFMIGTLLGVATLVFAVMFATACGSYRFSLIGSNLIPAAVKMLIISAVVFIIAGASEEVLLRGYPLQTLLRSQPAWVGIILTSVLFSSGHLFNPHVVPFFTFANTLLAGIWLAVAYLRTRSLWFPIGVHWAWNWMLGSLFGLPVSGITMLSSAPLILTTDMGPAWLTGGAYGIEGGAACTVAITISTFFIWRTRLVTATEEMQRAVMSDE